MVSEVQRAQSPSSHFLPPTPLATVYALKTSANYPDTFIRVVILLVNSFFVNFNYWALPMKLFSYFTDFGLFRLHNLCFRVNTHSVDSSAQC